MTHTGLTTRRIVGAITSKIFPNCVVGPIALLYDPPIPSLTALYPPVSLTIYRNLSLPFIGTIPSESEEANSYSLSIYQPCHQNFLSSLWSDVLSLRILLQSDDNKFW